MRTCRAHLAFVWLLMASLGTCLCSGTVRADERQYWMGEILMPNTACPRLTFVVKFRRAEGSGEWKGWLSIPRGCGIGGVIDSPLDAVVVTEERLSFATAPPTQNNYEAARRPGEKVATGQVVIGGAQAVPIRMWAVSEEAAKNAAPRRPQVPEGELPYVVQEVHLPASGGGVNELTGVLSTPPGAGPFAGVVLVSDEEPQDRDHSEGTHKPFLVLADRLTRAGFAVLRCDDRGIGGSGGSSYDSTLEDAARDVLDQVKFLAKATGIDAARIGVIGRGEGAQVGAMAVGTEGSGIAFAVLLAPAGRKGIEVACAREERQLEAMGEDPTYIKERVARLRKALELAMVQGKEQELNTVLQEDARAYVAAVRGMGLEMTKDQVAMWASSRADVMRRERFRSWLAADAGESLRKLSCPVLVLIGALDMVMPTADELPAVKAALASSGSKKAEVKVLARTNHWMQQCATGFADEVDAIETTMSEESLGEIVSFVRSVTQR